MVNNHLIKLLKRFSRKEFSKFVSFCDSPYFNKHKDVRVLMHYFDDIYPKFTSKNCKRTQISKAVFSSQGDYKKLPVIFTYTVRLLEQFLIQEEFKSSDFQQILLLRKFRRMGEYAKYEKLLTSIRQSQEKNPFKDHEHFNMGFLIAKEADLFYDQMSRHEKDFSIQEKQENLDNFYFAQKLLDACEMMVRSRIMKVDLNPNLIQPILDEIQSNMMKYESIPSILLYFKTYLMLKNNDDALFYEVLNHLHEYENNLNLGNLKTIYNHLQHYCIEQINLGNQDFLSALFEIYQRQLKNELLHENGYLSEWYFKNIVTVALRLNETLWTKNFIDAYIEKVDPKVRTNTHTFNLASYYYKMGDYKMVIGLLNQVEYSDFRYIQGTKAMLLRTYYELNEEEPFYALINSFKQFLTRSDLISESRKIGFFNLMSFAKRAFDIKNSLEYESISKSKSRYLKLETDIENADSIFNRSWLKTKLVELSNFITL